MIHQNILSAIGRTPLVAVNRLHSRPGVNILAKIESSNPGGSVKDRVALAMIEAAEQTGELTPDKIVIEATSGNTGIGLAMVCAVKGYRLQLVMPESASEERKRIMRAYGADLLLTPGHLSTDGAIEEAYRLAREEPDKYVLVDQFNNPASIEAHYRTTGQEIWDDTEGKFTHVVTSLGTSGTAMGITKRIKELNPDACIVAVEPYANHKIQGLKNMQASYPPGIYDKKVLDRILHVEDEEAFETCRRMAREEGLFTGMSSGAAMAGALKLAEELEQGLIVVILPDSGERYLSTPLFVPKVTQGVGLMDAATGRTVHPVPAGAGFGLFTPGPALDSLDDPEAWRRIAILDVLARRLAAQGEQVVAVVGLADMDDRALKKAKELAVGREEFSTHAVATLQEMAKKLGMGPAIRFAQAGKSVDTALTICRKLLAKGAAYEKLRSVYFDVLRFEQYGNMSQMDMDKLSLGKTVDLADYVKANPKDFTLLKRASLADLKTGDCLQTDWGNVRPSWFLQHAATAMDALPDITVFLGGRAHLFPHLENFRAIWSLGRGSSPQAWAICQSVDGAGKQRPPGIEELELRSADDWGAFRMWLLSASHHKPLAFSKDNLTMWRRNRARIHGLATDLRLLAENEGAARSGHNTEPDAGLDQTLVDLRTGLKEALEEDLALHRFWPVLFGFCREARDRLQAGGLGPAQAEKLLKGLREADAVLGFLEPEGEQAEETDIPSKVAQLVADRKQARQDKDFALADQLRDQIHAAGFTVTDTSDGAVVRAGAMEEV
jgi:cystathionine beta-synthase